MSNKPKASIRTSVGRIEKMVNKTALKNNFFEEIMLRVRPERVQTLFARENNSAIVANTFWEEPYFDDITLNVDGGEEEEEPAVDALIPVEEFTDYLGIVDEGGTVEISFEFGEGDDVARRAVLDGALEAGIMLPQAQETVEKVPTQVHKRFDSENRMRGSGGDIHETFVETTVGQVEKIIDAVELDQDIDAYPIIVDDGSFVTSVGQKEGGRNYVHGDMTADVEGKDAALDFTTGFEPVFNSLGGDVQLQFSPPVDGDSPPMAVVQDGETGVSLRYILASVPST